MILMELATRRLAASLRISGVKLEGSLLRQSRFDGSDQQLGALKQHPHHVSNRHRIPIRYTKTSRSYATSTKSRLDVAKLRHEVDKQNRIGSFTLHKRQGGLKLEPSTANAIYEEFLHQKGKSSNGENIKRLAAKYKTNIEELTTLAMITYTVPDLSDPVKRNQLPPSQHKPNAGLILQGCAQTEEPLAIVHVLTAEYLRRTFGDQTGTDITAMFTQGDITAYRKTLSKLSARSKEFQFGPETLTLQGLFAERENRPEEAKASYLESIKRSHLKFDPATRHPLLLPLTTPWNALGYLLQKNKDPTVQAEAKKYFQIGADEADDPLSYYELASYEDRGSAQWLQCTSKAAASGHRQAIVDLADYYQELDSEDSKAIVGDKARQSLNWLLGWKKGSAATLAREWLAAASDYGHKPSTLKLADYHESIGDYSGAENYLRKLMEPPTSANQSEEWPQLVQIGKERLQMAARRV